MNYPETLEYLYHSAPLFQNIGAGAYKEGLTTTEIFDRHFGHPHRQYSTIHVGGTNGKGSTSHTLAAILQNAGFKVGLYTSPHLIDFRERIRVNGKPISQQRVIDFVEDERPFFEPLHPSFFELTTALALLYFAEQKVDIAIIEVGLGGRLDCTNIILPELSIITNISLDHTQFLGDSLEKIAREKAGIIKPATPVVVGQAVDETRNVFTQTALSKCAPLFFAEEETQISKITTTENGQFQYTTERWGTFVGQLAGTYQKKNAATVLSALAHLPQKIQDRISIDNVQNGFAHVCELTGLMGRWQRLQQSPLIICDTGHNLDAWQYLSLQLKALPADRLHIVFGVCNDKDVRHILELLPKEATYYFTQATVARALNADELQQQAAEYGLFGSVFANVATALKEAEKAATPHDAIFVGGSSFIVADLLASL